MVAAVNPGFTRIVLVPQGASQGASEKSGILWSSFTLKISKTLHLKWFSYRQNIVGSYIFIHAYNFPLLIGVFRPFALNGLLI